MIYENDDQRHHLFLRWKIQKSLEGKQENSVTRTLDWGPTVSTRRRTKWYFQHLHIWLWVSWYWIIFWHFNSIPQKIFLLAIHLLVSSPFSSFSLSNFHFHLMKILLPFIHLSISFLPLPDIKFSLSLKKIFLPIVYLGSPSFFVFPFLCLAFNLLKGGQSCQTTRAHHNRNFL